MRARGPSLTVLLAPPVAAFAGAAEALAQGCAMCGSAFAGDDQLGRAFSVSVLFLMAAPYTIAALVAGFVFYMYRRTSGRRRASVIDLARASRLLHRRGHARNPGGEVS
jgi:hypothetical protein